MSCKTCTNKGIQPPKQNTHDLNEIFFECSTAQMCQSPRICLSSRNTSRSFIQNFGNDHWRKYYSLIFFDLSNSKQKDHIHRYSYILVIPGNLLEEGSTVLTYDVVMNLLKKSSDENFTNELLYHVNFCLSLLDSHFFIGNYLLRFILHCEKIKRKLNFQ